MNLKLLSLALLSLLSLQLSLAPAAAQEPSPEEIFLTAFNRILREEFGARALAPNATLNEVAEALATEVGCSDDPIDFDIQQAVKAAGYTLYPGDTSVRTTRVPLLPIVNSRPIEEMAEFYAADIFENNINQPGRFYREIGVGVAECQVSRGPRAQGSTPQYALFVILGSQPDVIPVVIENGASEIAVAAVPARLTLSVHQENSRQRPGIFGRGAQVRLSTNEALSDSTRSQNFAAFLDWEVEACGENTLFYELSDTEGVVVTGQVSVNLVCP